MRALVAVAMALLVSGCRLVQKSSKEQPPPRPVSKEPEAVKPAEPESREPDGASAAPDIKSCGTGRSHKGTLDVPKSELEGVASYYGKQYDGKQTASGDLFDMNKFSAAHRTLRLGTLVRVTNMDNGRSLEVCVNDRGPYAKDRVLDLSYAAAKELGVLSEGTAPVRIEIIGKK